VGFVPVGGIVEIERFRFGGFQNLQKVGSEVLASFSADFRAGVGQLDHGGVTAQVRRLSLLVHADFDKVLARQFRGGTGPVGGNNPGEAEIRLAPAGADAGKGHDFQVVGMGTDPEVGGGGEGGGKGAATRNVGIGPGLEKFHR
jgi:hypothetical protein